MADKPIESRLTKPLADLKPKEKQPEPRVRAGRVDRARRRPHRG